MAFDAKTLERIERHLARCYRADRTAWGRFLSCTGEGKAEPFPSDEAARRNLQDAKRILHQAKHRKRLREYLEDDFAIGDPPEPPNPPAHTFKPGWCPHCHQQLVIELLSGEAIYHEGAFVPLSAIYHHAQPWCDAWRERRWVSFTKPETKAGDYTCK